MIKQKTVRFHFNRTQEVRALEKLEKYKEYGFDTSQQMLIAAIIKYQSKEEQTTINVDELAGRIVERLEGKIQVRNQPEEEIDNYSKAMEFIDAL